MFRKNIPNLITCIRILGAVALIFIEPLSTAFIVVYSLCAVSDALDGFIARKLGITSELGAKLDSIADLSFFGVMVLSCVPTLFRLLPVWVICFGCAAIAVRIACYAVSAIRLHRFASMHTMANKVTTALLFALPYVILTPVLLCYSVAVCAAAGFAAVQELIMHCTEPKEK